MLGGVARFLLYLGLAGCVGGAVTAWLLSRVAEADASLERVRSVGQRTCRGLWLASLALIGLVTLGRAWLQVAAFRDSVDPFWPMARRVLGSTSWGDGFVLQLSGLLLSLVGARFSHDGRWRPGVVAGIGAICLIAAPAWQGHAAGVERLVPLSMLADIMHTAAFTVWIGTLGGIWLTFLAGRDPSPSADDRAAITRTLVVRFSPLALTCGTVLVLTGVAAALLHLTEVADLWGSAWGRWFLAKLVAVVGVLGAGGYNWRFVTPRLGSREGHGLLRAGIRRELIFASLALLLTAILTGTGTPGSE
ncbi:MAG: CopD family protein [Gemmatimonadaceae bacterium]